MEKITGECQEAKLNLIQLRTERDRLLELVADSEKQHVTTKEEFDKLDEQQTQKEQKSKWLETIKEIAKKCYKDEHFLELSSLNS